MLKNNPLYPITTTESARKHILALIPVGQKNQIIGLLNTLQNSILQEAQSEQLHTESVQSASSTKTRP